MKSGLLRRGGSTTTHPTGRRTSGSPSFSFRSHSRRVSRPPAGSARRLLFVLSLCPLCRAGRDGARLRRRPGSARGREHLPFHPRQRARGRGHPRPPHAGRDPHDLVQGRVGGRGGRQDRARPFPRAPDVQGHREEPAGALLADSRDRRRPGERLHHRRLHRIFPAHRPRISADGDGIRSRPHDRPRADRRQGAARARRGARRVQHARRQQPGGAARRAGHRGALSQSSLWTPGDRLAPGDREAQPRGCARVLPALLHAQQRGGGDRRRRHRRGGPAARREDLRQGGQARRDRSAQTAPGAARPSRCAR